MPASVIRPTETSVQDGSPIELYQFITNYEEYDDEKGMHHVKYTEYLFTSDAQGIVVPWEDGTQKVFNADTIQRENIIPGTSGSVSDCHIKVDKDNLIAKLYQGAPPESSVQCLVYRLHTNDLTKIDIIFRGLVSQVEFHDSEVTLTVTMDAWLQKELPNGMTQYYCNWSIFDKNCHLKKKDYEVEIMIDQVDKLDIISADLLNYPNGYFTGGRLYWQDSVRMIADHNKDKLVLKYPTVNPPRNKVKLVPGCDQLFTTCAERYKNTLHFSGVPYTPPTNAEKNPTGGGTYWIDSTIIQRDTDGFVGTISGV